jgi:anti-sigma-K factor RskA
MMEFETQIKVQAFLDGELPEAEAREIAALIARDREAAALHAELKNTRRALAGAEQAIQVPESQEFYWSKIRREIERTEPATRPEVKEEGVGWGRGFLRWLIPAWAIASVVAAMFALKHTGLDVGGPEMVTALADSDAITFNDESSGTTLVWFSYPAEKGIATDQSPNTLD